jgi:phosphoribosyl 1,2-cyclic phosphodiesterase
VPGNRFRIWAGHEAAKGDIAAVFRLMMTPPLFPDVMDTLEAAVEFKNFTAGETLVLRPGLEVRTAALNHPGGATAYRIEWAGKSLAYTTDTEHRAEGIDAALQSLVSGADMMIYDANYTDEDYPRHRGWGHSTWQEGVKLAQSAGVRRLVLFHHDPARTDAMLDDIARAASAAFADTIVAREGLTLTL